jgi:hypothetical protein
MNIEINLILKEEKDYIIIINHFKAIKNEEVIKEKKEKDYVNKIDLKNKLLEIESIFKNKNNLILKSNENNFHDVIKNIFNLDIVLLDNVEEYEEELFEIKNNLEENHKVQYLPDFVYKIEKDEFKKNILLFLISSYFDENQHEIFDFPLFLEMKKLKEIEEDVEVEEFIEILLEKFRELGV